MPRRYNDQQDVLTGDVSLKDASLLDFWRWAFSDLCDDDIKGIFAEWMILKLLDLPGLRRVSWANNDLVTESGVTIEVKATAYWQSWKLLDAFGKIRETPSHPMTPEAKIGFRGLSALDSVYPDHIEPKAKKERAYKSSLYFFAFQKEKNPDEWDAMNLHQWEFYALRQADLSGARTITLRALKEKCSAMDASQFAQTANAMIAEVERLKKNPEKSS